MRLDDRHIKWLKAHGPSMTEAVRAALDMAIEQESYLRARKILERIPLDTDDEWGNPEEFMLQRATRCAVSCTGPKWSTMTAPLNVGRYSKSPPWNFKRPLSYRRRP